MKYFILGILFSTLSQASCENTNFYLTKPHLFELPIVNQGDMSTCYAHSLAQLYNIDKGEGKKIMHPYWIAYNHKHRYLHWSPRKLDYSLMSWAQKDLKKTGSCEPTEVQSRLDALKNGVAYTDDQLMYAFSYFFKYKNLRSISTPEKFEKVFKDYLFKIQERSFDFERPWTHAELHSILAPLREKMSGIGMMTFLKKHVLHDCPRSEVTEILASFGRKRESNADLASRIETLLAESKTIGIGYCAKPVYARDPASSRDIKIKPRILRAASLKCGAHYSVLVGSRKVKTEKGESCEYLLRNTYGEGQWAHASMNCFCYDVMTETFKECKSTEVAVNMRNLGCWVDREKMLNNTYDISYLK